MCIGQEDILFCPCFFVPPRNPSGPGHGCDWSELPVQVSQDWCVLSTSPPRFSIFRLHIYHDIQDSISNRHWTVGFEPNRFLSYKFARLLRLHLIQMSVDPQVPVQLTRDFLKVGTDILGLDPRSSVTTLIELFRSNFKYSPSRCAFLFLRIVNNPVLPNAYEPKHLLWTLNFLLTYATERRMCCFLKANRKTIRKYTWPTITALASLSGQYVS